jgi:branched-chain amino acid aminotransferase
VRDGEVWTSRGDSNLPGITRWAVLEVARRSAIPTHEADFTVHDVYAADEAFVTGTFGGLTPVRTLDGNPIGDGTTPMTDRLRDLYDELVAEDVAGR